MPAYDTINYSAGGAAGRPGAFNFALRNFYLRVRVGTRRIVVSHYYIAPHYYTAGEFKNKF